MLPTSRHFLHLLPLALASALFALFSFLSATSHAQSNQQVTVGVGATTLTINGQTSPGAFVTVLKDTTPVGTTSAAGDGAFSLTLTFENGGINQISIFSETPGGAVSDPLTTSINVIGHQNTSFYALLPPVISLESTQLTLGQAVKTYGETIPGGAVTISTDTGHTAQVVANGAGEWSATIPTTTTGLRYLIALVRDDQSRQSPPTRQVAYSVASPTPVPVPSVPVVPIIPIRPTPTDPPAAPATPIITSPQNNQYVTSRNIAVVGSAQNDTLVELWQDGRVVGSAFANSSDYWEMAVSIDGSQSTLQARACRLGLCSALSPSVTVYFSSGAISSGSLFTILDVPEYNFTAPSGDKIILPILIEKGKAPFELTVDWGDDTVQNITYDALGRYTLAHSYASPGLFNGFVKVVDKTGAVDVHNFAVEIVHPEENSLLDTNEERIVLLIIALIALRLLLPYLSSSLKRKK